MFKPFSLTLLLSLTTFTTITMELPMYRSDTKAAARSERVRIRHSRSSSQKRSSSTSKDFNPDVIPAYFARYISNQLFNDKPDQIFEDVFIEILVQQKKPKLYPELVKLRKSLLKDFIQSIR